MKKLISRGLLAICALSAFAFVGWMLLALAEFNVEVFFGVQIVSPYTLLRTVLAGLEFNGLGVICLFVHLSLEEC